jgi:hypothetical protein
MGPLCGIKRSWMRLRGSIPVTQSPGYLPLD